MRFFVTGTSGRLGRVVVDRLVRAGHIVKGLYRGGEPVAGCSPIYGDLSNLDALRRGAKGCDVVLHLAALVSYTAQWDALWKVNVQGTRNVCSICADEGIKLVHCSTTAVYGKKLAQTPANETTPTSPTDLYGRSKLEAERIVGEYYSEIPTVIIRPAVLYGPTYITYYAHFFKLIEEGRLPIFGDGKNIIPFVHASDVANAFILAAQQERANGNVYVLSGNLTMTQEEIIATVAKMLNVRLKKKYINPLLAKAMARISTMFKKAKASYEHIDVLSSHRIFDCSAAHRDLGWTPKIDLKTGLAQMVAVYKEWKEKKGG